MNRLLLRFLLAFTLLLPRCSAPLYAQAVPAQNLTIALSTKRLQQPLIKLPSGATLNVESGGTLAVASGGSLTVGGVSLATPTTVGNNLFSLANPGAVTFLRVNADNSVTARTAAQFLDDILPTQTGNADKVLKTNGTTASWGESASSITDPNVAYVRTNGSDATGDGSPAKPFRHPNAAILAGFKTLDLGVGSFTSITEVPAGNLLYLRGKGQTATTISGCNVSVSVSIFDYGLRSFQLAGITSSAPLALVGVLVAGDIHANGWDVSIQSGSLITGIIDTSLSGSTAGNISVDASYAYQIDATGYNGEAGTDGTVTIKRGAEVGLLAGGAPAVMGAVIGNVWYDNSYP